jgi:hypothetical protein
MIDLNEIRLALATSGAPESIFTTEATGHTEFFLLGWGFSVPSVLSVVNCIRPDAGRALFCRAGTSVIIGLIIDGRRTWNADRTGHATATRYATP